MMAMPTARWSMFRIGKTKPLYPLIHWTFPDEDEDRGCDR
jgi:hypothetical protein